MTLSQSLVSEKVTSGIVNQVFHEGKLAGELEYDWVRDCEDLLRADKGLKPEGGNVLYVSNMVVHINLPEVKKELLDSLPMHRWIVWMKEDGEGHVKIHAPHGLPKDFYTRFMRRRGQDE